MNPAASYAVSPRWGPLLAELGISARNVLLRAGLRADLLSGAPASLTQREHFAFWRALEAEAPDPSLPIRLGERLTAGNLHPTLFDPALFAALCSEHLNGAATRLVRHRKIVGPLRLVVTVSPTGTAIRYLWPGAETPPALLATTELLFWVSLVRLATRAPVQPTRVTLPEPPKDPGLFGPLFGFSSQRSPVQSVTFSAEDATRPFLSANDEMWEFFGPELRRRLSELEAGASTGERVRAALLELLPAGEGTMGAVARRLHTSTRTLQRHLQGEETTFQAVLNGTREALALHYLTASGLSVAEIAFLLGYDDPNSFYRAFRAWTGRTPEKARVASPTFPPPAAPRRTPGSRWAE